jgi:hypothetical protein
MTFKLNLLNIELSTEPKQNQNMPVLLMKQEPLKDKDNLSEEEYMKELRKYLIKQMPKEDPSKIDYFLKMIEDFNAEE